MVDTVQTVTVPVLDPATVQYMVDTFNSGIDRLVQANGTDQIVSAIQQGSSQIANAIQQVAVQLEKSDANMKPAIDAALNNTVGLTVRQVEDIAPGFNRAMLLHALKSQLPDIQHEMNNPTGLG